MEEAQKTEKKIRKNMEQLDQKLEKYATGEIYPFHMPGHKRAGLFFPNPYQIDITEIDGFDNLHHPEGILKDGMTYAAKVFGAKQTFYLVNGSTCGLLAAVSAAVPKRGRLLMARNCHKAVYHAAYLRELSVDYLYPQITEVGIQGAIRPDEVRLALSGEKKHDAVVITSPTYDGVVSDIEAIARIVHEHGIPLIVDEAHGAHFGFSEAFPVSAKALGADVVIQSIHKTLPAFTQTALLHLQSDRVSEAEMRKFLGIYETSSPSYIFMAGIEKCVRMLEKDGGRLFSDYEARLREFFEKTKKLQKIKILKRSDFGTEEAFDFDPSKLILSVRDTDMTGQELYDILLSRYGLQMEMASGFYVTAMTSIMDRKEGFDRLAEALLAVDGTLGSKKDASGDFIKRVYRENEKKMEIADAVDGGVRKVSLDQAEGKIAAEYVYLYPPGIPMLVPGEQITGQVVENMKNCGKLGLNVQGTVEDGWINVVNF